MRPEPSTDRGVPYGGIGVALLRLLADQGGTTFTARDAGSAARSLGASSSYVPVLLHRLERSRLISRVKRGTYALAGGLHGVPSAHPFALGMALVDPSAISGWSALNHYGLTEQIPRVITLTTPKRIVTPSMRGAVHAAPSQWSVGTQRFEIVVVVAHHFFGFEETWLGDVRVRMFDRERALLDCFAMPRRFGGIEEGLGILEEHSSELEVERLVDHAKRYSRVVVAKRVGYALEHFGIAPHLVERLRQVPMKGLRALDPTRATRGVRDRRWHLVINLDAPRLKRVAR